MADYIGSIQIPDKPVPATVFPIRPDYGYGYAEGPEVVAHPFESGNAKIEQRFKLGNGLRRFKISRATLNNTDRKALLNLWTATKGGYGAFFYDAPSPDGTTTRYACRFENAPLSYDLVGPLLASAQVVLVEDPDNSAAPIYTLNSTVTRFPSAALQTALLSQVQEFIHLVKITPVGNQCAPVYLADRRCTIGGQLYLARLVNYGGIGQTISTENASDQADFTFGNADRVMEQWADSVDLNHATVEYSQFHIGTGTKIDLWTGNINDWSDDGTPDFKVKASDGLYRLTLPYPCRTISRACWKDANDGLNCPMDTAGGTNLSSPCDKGFDTPAGCVFHNMAAYFGGLAPSADLIHIKDNSTGRFGYGRQTITSASITDETVFEQVVPEVYTDVPMTVNAKLIMGREESEFYQAIGIVSEGPISGFAPGGTLDGQLHHGPGSLGLGSSVGNDPNDDPFSLEAGGSYGPGRAAGTAWLAIRRNDEKGFQPSRLSDHAMQAVVAGGVRGWTWSAPGERLQAGALSNPIWVAVNVLLRGLGLKNASAAVQEAYFDVQSAIDCAAICDTMVSPLYSRTVKAWVEDTPAYYDEQGQYVAATGHYSDQAVTQERQFVFRGVINEQKPLRQWIQEILNNCLGCFTVANGKIKFAIRCNASAVEDFTTGNILFNSLSRGPLTPQWTQLRASFGDEEFNFAGNAVSLTDIDYGKLMGGASSPLLPPGKFNLCGTSTKSQAARIVTARLREELGGITAAEWKKGRKVTFTTTVLALNTEPGMVCSVTHRKLPGGYGKIRITSWRLNPADMTIQVEGRTVVDSMYDLTIGPKPADVAAGVVPDETTYATVPDLQGFRAGKSLGNGAFAAQMYWDAQRQLMLVDYGCQAPSDRTNWIGVQVWIKSPKVGGGYTYTKGDRIIYREDFVTSASGLDLIYYGNIGIEFASIPTPPESWTFIAASVGRNGQVNVDAQGNPTGPTVPLTTLTKSDYVQNFAAVVVTKLDQTGQQQWGISATWTNADIPRYAKTRIMLLNYGGQGNVQQLSGDNPLTDLSSLNGYWPWPDTAQSVRCVIQSEFGDGTVAPIASCPYVDLTVQRILDSTGQEYCGLVNNISVSGATYAINNDGQRVFRATITWTPPANDLRYAGGTLWIIRGGVSIPLGQQAPNAFQLETTDWPAVDENDTFFVLSVDTAQRVNTYAAPVTPKLDYTWHAPTAGAQGSEYTPVVTGFGVAVTNPATSDGTAKAVVTVTFTPPANATWGLLMVRFSTDAGSTWDTRSVGGRSPIVFDVPVGATAVTYRVGGFSVDVNGKVNTYYAGVTPTVDIIIGSTAGALDLSKAKATSYDSDIFTITNGKLKIWAFDGSIIATGSISSPALNTVELLVGGGGNKPGKLGVYGAAGTLIGFMGVSGSDEGVWAATGAFGGSGFSNANFKFSSAGATISEATLLLHRTENVGQSYQQSYAVIIDSAFSAGFANPTFTGLTVRREGGNYSHRCVHINRGIVCLNNGMYQVAALYSYNGDTTGQDNTTEFWGELTLRNTTGVMNIYLCGNTGEVRTLGTVNVTSSAWNAGHVLLGSNHLWVDANGRLRIKSSAPTSDTDGTVVGTQS